MITSRILKTGLISLSFLILTACGGSDGYWVEIGGSSGEPLISLTNMDDDAIISEDFTAEIKISGEVADVADLDTLEVWIDGVEKASVTIDDNNDDGSITAQYTIKTISFADGSNHTIQVKAYNSTDEDGVAISATMNFTYDIEDVADGSDDGSSDGSSDGSADGSDDGSSDGSDDGSSDGSADGSDDGSDDGSADGSADGSDDGSSDGSDDGSADGDGDDDDTNDPSISNIQLKNAALTAGGTAVITATVTDASDVEVELFKGSTSIGLMAAGSSNTYTGLWDTTEAGSFTLTVKATDASGNTSSQNKTITVAEGDGEVVDPNWESPAAKAYHAVSNFNEGTYVSGIKMNLHIPADLPKNAPVVLAMHGCSQTALSFKNTSGWTALADKYKFFVIFPDMNKMQNGSNQSGNQYGCFNWAGYYGQNWGRGIGDSNSLMQMIRYVQETYSAGKAYVTGLSAGGGMSAVMGAFYPDEISGVAPMAGPVFGCANYLPNGSKTSSSFVEQACYDCMGITSSFTPRAGSIATMNPTKNRDAAMWAQHIKDEGPANYTGPYPRIISWIGTKDQLVDPVHSDLHVQQWTGVQDIDDTADNSTKTIKKEGGRSHVYNEYNNAEGTPVVATVVIDNMGHGIAVDKGTGVDQGGDGSATDCYGLFCNWSTDVDIFSSYYTAKWWGILDGSDGSVDNNISVEISSHKDGASVAQNGTVTIVAAASDDEQGISFVQFSVNGTPTCIDEYAPYECDIETKYDNGTKLTITAKAFNNTDYSQKSDSINIWVGESVFECIDHSATLTNHAAEGRAVRESISWSEAKYTLNGSGETETGTLTNLNTLFDVRETEEGYFEFGKCSEL